MCSLHLNLGKSWRNLHVNGAIGGNLKDLLEIIVGILEAITIFLHFTVRTVLQDWYIQHGDGFVSSKNALTEEITRTLNRCAKTNRNHV